MSTLRFSLLAPLILTVATAFAQPPDRVPGADVGFGPLPPGPVANALVERLYTPAEIAQAMGLPTLLTLHLHDVPPQEAFDAVTAQSGIPFRVGWAPHPVSVDCDRQPFWLGVQSLLQQSGFCIAGSAIEGFELEHAAHYAWATKFLSGPNVTAGPFVVELTDCTISRRVSWAQPDAADPRLAPAQDQNPTVQIAEWVVCDPKLQMISGQSGVESAIDNTGRSLKLDGDWVMPTIPTKSRDAVLYLLLKTPDPAALSLRTLTGHARIRVATHGEKWEIPDPTHAGIVAKSFGPPDAPLKLTVKAETKGDGVGTSLTLAAEGNDVSWQLAQTLLSSVRWIDAQGKPVACIASNTTGTSHDKSANLQSTYQYAHPDNPVAEPLSLVLIVPTDVRTVLIPFAFHDLPLP